MLNHSHHPLVVGIIGQLGLTATSPEVVGNTNLSLYLQLIVTGATLFKLWLDYKRDELKAKYPSKNEDSEPIEGNDSQV